MDNENEFLYSKGHYLTKIKEKDLPEDYTKFKSRTIWYTIGYIKTSGVKDLYYTYIKENHLFKDDYLYISYDKKIEEYKDKYGCEEIRNYDFLFCICRHSALPPPEKGNHLERPVARSIALGHHRPLCLPLGFGKKKEKIPSGI